MAEKTVAQKMRLKPDGSVALLHPPAGIEAVLGLGPTQPRVASAADADAVLLFVTTQAELEERLAVLRPTITPQTTLWVCYPKGSKSAGHDVSRDTIWAFGQSLGLGPVGLVSIDSAWSGFRLRLAP